MAEHSMEAYEARLHDSLDVKQKVIVLTELRDSIERWCQGPSYSAFLQKFIPIFLNILIGPPVFISTSPEQRLRNCVLEILHRLPLNQPEASEPHCATLVDRCLELVKIENEDNAVLCLKIIMDHMRYHVKTLAARAQPFLNLITELFDNMEHTVQETFDGAQGGTIDPASSTAFNSPRPGSPVASAHANVAAELGNEQQQTRQLVKGMQSFKVLAECPVIVVSIFQTHRQLAPKNVTEFTSRIKKALQLQAGPQRRAHEEAHARGDIFTGVAKEIKNRTAFGDLITAQVKTMSFLAYLLRTHQNLLQDYLIELPTVVVRILQDCPREKSATRKELLVAIRHIINFNFRLVFLPKINDLLDERTLIGDGLTAYETQRPLAYTMLADLIHHVRDQLKPDQIRSTILVYIRNLHDDIPGTSYQTMSVKLLLNMAERMSKVENKQDARHYMMLVLNGIADKFAAMNRQYPNAVKLANQTSTSVAAVPENYLADKNNPPDWDETDIFNAMPIKVSNPKDRATDPVSENKFLFKNCLHGLKAFFMHLKNSNPPEVKDAIDAANTPLNWNELSYGFDAEQVSVLVKLFREGAQVFKYYNLEKPDSQATPEMLSSQHMASSGKEEKDLLETFATIFHHVDPATFHEVFQSEIPFLYEQSFKHAALLHIPQFLLASEATSPAFAGMLLQFLMSKIEEVGTADTLKSSILLRLFKLSFMAVTLFSNQNEQVLLPHVTKLITQCIELSVSAEEPTNYFLLLRSLFRSIGGGRFELLYKEILPLLEMLLEVLNNLLKSAQKPEQRDLFVELSLTVPARLSHLLPLLSYLMRPLVVALRAGSELIAQGLRTLELCVDNLTADYLDPIMAPVMDDLMSALWDHLKPHPHNHFHAHTTMRILGKLGGRNRKFITGPPELDYKNFADDEPSFDVRLVGSIGERAMPARLGIDSAIDKLREPIKSASAQQSTEKRKADDFYKLQAYKLVVSNIKMLIGFDNLPDDFARLVRLQANDLSDRKFDAGADLFSVSERAKSVTKRDAQQQILLKLLKACMVAASIDELKEDARAFLQNIYRHFMLVELGTAVAHEKHKRRPFDMRLGEGPVFIETSILAKAISDSLASEVPAVREIAEDAMQSCRNYAATIFGGEDKLEHLPFFHHLAQTFIHACYEEEWFIKSGGTLGVNLIITKLRLSNHWLVNRQLDIVRALLYVIKDMPQDLPAYIRLQSRTTLQELIKRVGANYKAEDLDDKESKLYLLCNRLIGEVSHMNKHVREAAQSALRTLAETIGVKIHEVVKPVKELLLAPIFNKPLRALPFAAQIGYIDAINFCLDMENDVLTFDEQLTRLLYETLALVDADDESLAAKPHEHRNSESIARLRVACLKLLTTAIRFPGFNNQQQAQHRTRIISIFFKCLYSRHKDVAAAANTGLKIVLAATQKLPKDLLQIGLRPILTNVQDPRRLSVEGLEGLRTLLKLLTTYFKVEIGTRLLDHMRYIAEPQTLQKVSFSLIEAHPKMKVVTAVFSVFHLLPSAAVQFLPELVDRVLKLEHALRRTCRSPFREPLIRYLNHYPNEAWQYFKGFIKDEVKGRFFAQILSEEGAGAIREAIVKDIDGFVSNFTAENMDEPTKAQTAVNALHVANSICQFEEPGKQLMDNAKARTALIEAAKHIHKLRKREEMPSKLRLAAVQSGEMTMHILTFYLGHHPDDLDSLFEVARLCTGGELRIWPSLLSYLYRKVITSDSIAYQRTIINRCVDTYVSKQASQELKSFVFHNILNPILANDAMRNWDSLFSSAKGTALLDRSMTDTIHNKLWKPSSLGLEPADDATHGIDHSRMELLQTTAFLIKYHHTMLQDARKDVIKFGWNYIRLDDVINKYAAYVLIAYFIANYDTPAKIAMQVYTALLKAHQTEGKNLVMQSLEILEPVLKKRLAGTSIMWAKAPKRILSEESSNIQQLTSIFQFLVRHPDLFYDIREGFAQIIIPNMAKVAQLPHPSAEHRKLALNLFSMIYTWESRTAKEQGSLDGSPSPAGGDRSQSPQGSKRGAVAPAHMRFMFIKYMVQFIATLPERFPSSTFKAKPAAGVQSAGQQITTETVTSSLDLLRKLLSTPYWDDLDVDAMFPKVTEQILCTEPKPDEKTEIWNTRVINTIQIVKVLVTAKPDSWVVDRLPQLQKLLARPLRSDNVDVQDALHSNGPPQDPELDLPPLMKRILDVIPVTQPDEDLPDADSPAEEFMTFLNTAAGDALNNGSPMAGVNLLSLMAQRKPEDVDVHIAALLKTLQTKLAKDHLHVAGPQLPGQPISQPQQTPQEAENTVNLIIRAIDMLSARISALGEQRRPYLSVLASLVERSSNNALCEKILSQVEQWVFNPTEPVPTLKEKTAVLQKMLLFEQRPDNTLYIKFMNLVIKIYEDQKIFRSELAVRMEHAFLIGLRSPDIDMRTKFMTIFDKALSRSTSNRFFKLISEQQWDILGDSFWLSQIIHLMLAAVDHNTPLHLHTEDFRCMPASKIFATYANDPRVSDVAVDDGFEALMVAERLFVADVGSVRARDVLSSLAELQHTDSKLAHDIWVAYFPMAWSTLSRDDRDDIEQGLVALLTKDFHQRQVDKRPNCVATLLEGIARAKPICKFPPHVAKYLAKSYDAWYIATTYMENLAMKPVVDTAVVRESNINALLETYASLEESDLFYGTWRRRAMFLETNAALSYEQNGIWDKAQTMYEQAQIKARTGSLPFSQSEYMLWEDQWVLCAEKLQQWEILGDFAKHENINDLYLEAMWRNYEAWNNNESREHLDTVIKAVSDAPNPRRMFFQAFMALLKFHNKAEPETPQHFHRICDENIQLSIKNWHKLPKTITNAHIGLLQNFQQLVELHDASVICQSLSLTNAQNLDSKSQELKVLLSTWRDRLPNLWDDINAWQDLVTWRQHIFQLINGTYLALLPQSGNATGNSYAYRGYHETAWIINRFAHVARKHQMPEVCITQLSKIYTLPNIEIQEAFLKLREQAKCHYQNRNELTSGLDVINNTNLNYFGPQQKAEFYTLKGMFLSKLNQEKEAHDAFGTALFFDIKLPKAWAEWGRYSDFLFKEEPSNLELAGNALSCYMEAAGQYKSAKSRKLLSRILWLLSLDDSQGTLAKTYGNYKGDSPLWYWVTFIPQLLNNLSRSDGEANIAHEILTKLAKTYPQAMHFQLRTSHEDMQVIRRSQARSKEQREKALQAKQRAEAAKQESPATHPDNANSSSRPGTSGGDTQMGGTNEATPKQEVQPKQEPGTTSNELPQPKQPWEHTEALVTTLRTAFPLLYASMEAMVEQIQKHFKCPPDEDAYRLIVALLNDALTYVSRSPHLFAQDQKLPSQTEANITRFAESILPAHIRKSFEADFVSKKPTMFEYIQKLRKWRDKLAERLDRRPSTFHLEQTTHLSGFRFVWYDEVEVPGQYLQHHDKNQDFVRIERFLPVVDLVRGVTSCHRRIKIRGHDGSVHPFAIQHPAPRHSRREERILQLFRMFNSTLSKKKESRRRNLQFHLPVMVPLSPQIRMIQDDASYITLQGIYEDFCRRNDLDKDEPTMFTMEKMRGTTPQKQEQFLNTRMETLNYVQERLVPRDVASEYFSRIYPTYDAFWLFRRQFSYQLAALTYMTFTMHMTQRYPNKMSIARRNGNIWGTDLLPLLSTTRPFFQNTDAVPFRLTPNLQMLMGPIHTEGIFTCAVMAIARCLTSDSSYSSNATPSANGVNGHANGSAEGNTSCDMDHQLSIFIRDEMAFWYMQSHRQGVREGELRENVQRNSDAIVNKALALAREPTTGNLPANQSVLDLVSKATSPEKLCQMDLLWMPWL